MVQESESVEFVPVYMTKKVKLKVLPENQRPRCCPDPFGCKPILLSGVASQENIDKGYSGSCYGYCGKHEFDYKEAHHVNDISHCIMTPLKGCIRFYNNISDFWNDELDLRRLRAMINPAICEECELSNMWHPITNYIDRGANDPEKRKWLCERCALRLGYVNFHPRKVGTSDPLYW